VPRTAELLRVHEDRFIIFYRLRQCDLLDLRPTLPAGDLRPKPQEFITVGKLSAVNYFQDLHRDLEGRNS